jgi:hypothetical protein
VRDVTSMRRDFLAALADIGFIPFRADAADPILNQHSGEENLLKAVIAGALWPRVARVALPPGAVKYDRVQGGAVRRENAAKDFKLRELRGGQVFVHPASVLFANAGWRSPFVVFFNKNKTTKVFLRDATEVGRCLGCLSRLLMRRMFRCRCMRCSCLAGRCRSTTSRVVLPSPRTTGRSSSRHGRESASLSTSCGGPRWVPDLELS